MINPPFVSNHPARIQRRVGVVVGFLLCALLPGTYAAMIVLFVGLLSIFHIRELFIAANIVAVISQHPCALVGLRFVGVR